MRLVIRCPPISGQRPLEIFEEKRNSVGHMVHAVIDIAKGTDFAS
jgi:hypothetical protein